MGGVLPLQAVRGAWPTEPHPSACPGGFGLLGRLEMVVPGGGAYCCRILRNSWSLEVVRLSVVLMCGRPGLRRLRGCTELRVARFVSHRL